MTSGLNARDRAERLGAARERAWIRRRADVALWNHDTLEQFVAELDLEPVGHPKVAYVEPLPPPNPSLIG